MVDVVFSLIRVQVYFFLALTIKCKCQVNTQKPLWETLYHPSDTIRKFLNTMKEFCRINRRKCFFHLTDTSFDLISARILQHITSKTERVKLNIIVFCEWILVWKRVRLFDRQANNKLGTCLIKRMDDKCDRNFDKIVPHIYSVFDCLVIKKNMSSHLNT